ncbi:MAG: DUF502 domain-containing protein [Halobacteriaceae archaeon]
MTVTATLRRGFVTGLVLVAPLAVTLFVAKLLYGWLLGTLTPFLAVLYGDPGPVVQVVSLAALVGLVTALGLAARRGIGRYAVVEFDHLMEAIPVIRAVYSSARQASNALVGHEEQFDRVALVEWPREGVHTVGFVTAETPAAASDRLGDEQRYDVFVPMTPNPMGGFLAIVPESRLTTTDLSVSEGLQLVLTTGLSGDDELRLDEAPVADGD